MKATLHTDGKSAFDAIIGRIERAKTSIEINSFIWCDDKTGRRVFHALLAAADRGVSITVRKDMLAWMFERGEESKNSMFHSLVPRLWLAAKIVELRYSLPGKPHRRTDTAAFLDHKNVTYEGGLRYDHTKYVLVDDDTLFVGGMNIEDRFVDKDVFGREWQDYLLELRDTVIVASFKARRDGAPRDPRAAVEFIINDPRGKKPRRFEWKPELLRLLRGARSSVIIAMAYLGDEDVTAALTALSRKGVRVQLLIPKSSNIQHEHNFAVASKLRDAGVEVYLCKKMLHAKVLLIDDIALLGSANLNKQAMSRLGELDVCATEPHVVKIIRDELHRQLELAEPAKDLRYKRFSAWLEGLVAQ